MRGTQNNGVDELEGDAKGEEERDAHQDQGHERFLLRVDDEVIAPMHVGEFEEVGGDED